MTAQADRVRSRWWWLAGLCGAVALAGLLVFLELGLDPSLERFDKLSSIGGFIVAVAGLAVSIWSVKRASHASAAEPATLLERAASDLAIQVRRQWRAELDARGMGHLDPIRLRWSATDRPVMPTPAEVVGVQRLPPPPARATRLRLAGDIDDMVRTLARLPSRQLVVIGAPGAGKSTLAVLLTLGLLARWQAGDPVPVLLTLTSWDPGREHLDTWLARRLAEIYPGFGGRGRRAISTAAQLVETGLVLPVLDGLDEMPEALHAPAVAALTATVGRDRPLVLTSRAEEYQTAVRQAESPLARAAVVEIEPVTAPDAAAYLPAGQVAGNARWRPVLAQLAAAPDGPLARTLSTPLMVYLARVAYQAPDGPDPAELLAFTDSDAIAAHLLDAYLPAVYARRTPPPPHHDRTGRTRYSPKQAQQWLAFLAAHLTDQRTTDLAWWRLRDAVPHFRLKLGLIAGLTFGFVLGLVNGPVTGLLAGSLAAFAYALMVGSTRSAPQRAQLNTTRLAQVLASGFFAGVGALVLGTGIGLVTGMDHPLRFGAVFGGGAALSLWLTAPVNAVLNTPVSPARVVTPGSALAHDRMIGVLSLVLSGPLCAALTFASTVRPTVGLAAGLGLAYGALGATVLAAWPSLVVARALLAARGRIPYGLMRFLDDAHRRGVLRQVGAVYQFRHARLQQHLAAHYAARAASSPSTVTAD